MTGEIVKFPYSAARRLHSRKPRRSKNGTPEERAAKVEQITDAVMIELQNRQEMPNVTTLPPRMPPIVDQAARIMAGYNRLDPVCQKVIEDLVTEILKSRK